MSQQVELVKHTDNQHSLVLWIHENESIEFVVCSYYDSKKPVGQRWSWGHYFDNLIDAVNYFNSLDS